MPRLTAELCRWVPDVLPRRSPDFSCRQLPAKTKAPISSLIIPKNKKKHVKIFNYFRTV